MESSFPYIEPITPTCHIYNVSALSWQRLHPPACSKKWVSWTGSLWWNLSNLIHLLECTSFNIAPLMHWNMVPFTPCELERFKIWSSAWSSLFRPSEVEPVDGWIAVRGHMGGNKTLAVLVLGSQAAFNITQLSSKHWTHHIRFISYNTTQQQKLIHTYHSQVVIGLGTNSLLWHGMVERGFGMGTSKTPRFIW